MTERQTQYSNQTDGEASTELTLNRYRVGFRTNQGQVIDSIIYGTDRRSTLMNALNQQPIMGRLLKEDTAEVEFIRIQAFRVITEPNQGLPT